MALDLVSEPEGDAKLPGKEEAALPPPQVGLKFRVSKFRVLLGPLDFSTGLCNSKAIGAGPSAGRRPFVCFDWPVSHLQYLKTDFKTFGIKFIRHFVIPVFLLCFKQLQIRCQYLNSRNVCLKKKNNSKTFLPQLGSLKRLAKFFRSPRASLGCGGHPGSLWELPTYPLWLCITCTKALESLSPAPRHPL